jgi:hypothetical protein
LAEPALDHYYCAEFGGIRAIPESYRIAQGEAFDAKEKTIIMGLSSDG